MESDILGVFQCGTSQERKGKKRLPFQREEGRLPKTFKLAFAKKRLKQSDQVHGNNLQSKLLEVQGQEQECLAISDYFVRSSLI
ncbi:hypothetical protein K7T47_002690 [Listeria monocytogenes]|nr:hypothetical protein [Listeria monocytogenes]EIA7581304.1 hypothetical protein [Listeria monocytogenes]